MSGARVLTGPAKPPGLDELILPINPANVRQGAHDRFQVEGVTNDLYNIANQLKELNPRLFINILHDRREGVEHPTVYVIMEKTARGTEEVVFRCTTLDARVLEHVRYLMHVPFEHRFKKAEAESEKYEADQKEEEMNDLVERVGLPLVRELRECGFLGEYGKGGGPSVKRPKFGRGA